MLAADLRMIVATMRRAQLAAGFPDLALRCDRLERAARLVEDHHEALARAAAADRGRGFGAHFPAPDLLATIATLRHAARHVGTWMAGDPADLADPRSPRPPSSHWPQGVVGVIAPWTYPVSLALAPLAGIFAAGNVALIKLSPYAPASSDLLADLVGRHFAPGELGVVMGDDSVGASFAELPFAHLVFSGSARAARSVAAVAAARLMPFTFAVGGKSPAVVSADADCDRAARYIMTAKLRHAGQCSRAVDHVLVADACAEAFVAAARDHGARILADQTGYPAIVNQLHHERLCALLADAESRGARRVPLVARAKAPARAGRAQACRMAPELLLPELLLDVTDDMAIMQEEVFGPILPILRVTDDEAAVLRTPGLPMPAQAWYFGADPAHQRRFAAQIAAASVLVNPAPEPEAVAHLADRAIPGNDLWSGESGFRRFSIGRRLVFDSGPAQTWGADRAGGPVAPDAAITG